MPRPFYIIGHNPNSVDDALKFLRSGANALEPDVHLDRSVGRFRICHDSPTDRDPFLEDYLDALAFELDRESVNRTRTNGHITRDHAGLDLRFITFDLKPEYDYDLRKLYDVIRTHFSNAHPEVLIATTISDPDCVAFLKSVEGDQRPNEFVGIDENTQPEDALGLFEGCPLQFVFAGGIDVFDFEPLNSLVGPRSFLDRIHRAAQLRETTEAMKMVYAWTVNNEDDIEAYLALDPPIDGLLTDYPDRVTRLLNERQNSRA